jgi:hypothetical protein
LAKREEEKTNWKWSEPNIFKIAISLVGIALCHDLLIKTQGVLPFGVSDACIPILLCIVWPLACFDCLCACCKFSQIPAYCNYQSPWECLTNPYLPCFET